MPGRKLKEASRGLTLPQEPFEVEAIKGAHLKWLGRLENVIRGRQLLSPEQVTGADKCDFGQWYFSEGMRQFGELPLFKEIGQSHEQVHATAREIVSLVAGGKIQDASNRMEQFAALKDQLFDGLDQLYLVALTQRMKNDG
jgi:hypothetical protein